MADLIYPSSSCIYVPSETISMDFFLYLGSVLPYLFLQFVFHVKNEYLG